ncbi:MAG: ABC transporter ATP-binding protein, partial [Carnobacterium sp.]
MLQLKNIFKKYTTGEFTQIALDGVSLNFRKNEFAAILGPSGSGKTTLLNIIGGLDQYDEGDLLINGQSTKKYKDGDWDAYRNNSVGFIFQSYNLIGHLTVLDNVKMGMTLSGVPKAEQNQRALDVLERVGLKEHTHKKPNQLSGGQMQRVAIARSLVNDPDIILADEPTGALDRKTSMEIMKLLKEISNEKLVIVITHDWHVCDYADEVITISDRQIVTKVESDLLKKGSKMEIELQPSRKINTFKIGAKNYKVSFLKYFSIALVFSIAILCFILS